MPADRAPPARVPRRGKSAPAHRILFPLACLQAAVSVPWWWAEWAGWLPGTTEGGLRHAHEMLLGFAPAVVGGFLFTALRWPVLGAAALAWLLGRAATVCALGGGSEAVLTLAYPVLLAGLAGLPFLRAARSGHNLVFAPILAGIAGSEALYQAGRLGWLADGMARGVWLAFDIVILLLLVMAGRILPAAMAGAVRQAGGTLADRNRPGLERIAITGMAVAAAVHVSGAPAGVAAAGWLLAGGAAFARQTRWRLALALRHRDLWPLQLGHLWLAGGLVAAAVGLWAGGTGKSLVHAVTVGGLGTITATMMVRTVLLRDRLPGPFPLAACLAATLLSAAAALRIGGAMAPAAGCWSAAFAVILGTLLTLWQRRRA